MITYTKLDLLINISSAILLENNKEIMRKHYFISIVSSSARDHYFIQTYFIFTGKFAP